MILRPLALASILLLAAPEYVAAKKKTKVSTPPHAAPVPAEPAPADSPTPAGDAPTTPSPTVNKPDPDDAGIEFKHFTAYSSSQTCAADKHALPFNNQIRGVNLGGWMVLEPWITPSLFYQFLGGNETSVAMVSSFAKMIFNIDMSCFSHRFIFIS